MTAPDHIDEPAICPHCDGLTVRRSRHIGPLLSGEITFADGRRQQIGPGEMYIGEPEQECN